MQELSVYASRPEGLSGEEIRKALTEALGDSLPTLKKVLLLPPDYTRLHSDAGRIVQILWEMLRPRCRVDIMPALGTHVPVSRHEWQEMFGSIPYDIMMEHRWRSDVVQIGEVPGDLVSKVSEGLMSDPIPVELNKALIDSSYDLILSIGQVVPHEVAGMANQTKNIFVGCGGSRMINSSHMLGAFYGMERIMGKDRTPVRAVFDYAWEHYAKHLPIAFVLTVTDAPGGQIRNHGLFIGKERSGFEAAVKLAQEKNIILMDRPIQKAVVYLDEVEFKSTWIGNKSVYRTRMAIADGGELIVLAPGVDKCGEDPAIDVLLRRYGYCGREKVLQLVQTDEALKGNLSAAAHLIHGSSDGRFRITYCTKHLSREEVEGVHYGYLPYDEAIKRYDPRKLNPGWNTLPDGEEIYYIPNPALGLWMEKSRIN